MCCCEVISTNSVELENRNTFVWTFTVMNWQPYQTQEFWLPQAYIKPENPFFAYEAENFDITADADTLKQHTLRYVGFTVAVALTVGLLAALISLVLNATSDTRTTNLVGLVIAGLAFALIFERLYFDFTLVAGVLPALREELQPGRYDLIPTTEDRVPRIIRAKFTLEQLRQWGRWQLHAALTVALVLMLAFDEAFTLLFIPSLSIFADLLPPNDFDRAFNLLLYTGSLLLIGAMLVLEIRKRLDVLIAVGLALSIRPIEKQQAFTLAGLAAFGLWAGSLLLLLVPRGVVALSGLTIGEGGGAIHLVAALIASGIVYDGYQRLTTIALNTAARQLETEPV